MPANSKYNFLLWRIPGLPIQGWRLLDEPGDVQVVVSAFHGNPRTFHGVGPLEPTLFWKDISDAEISDIKAHSDSREAHINRVSEAVDAIRSQGLRKVVIARKEVLDLAIDAEKVFGQLAEKYPQAVVYALHLDGELWMGATPETLLTSDESHVYTMALAGTRKPDGPAFAEKEFDEQAAVTDSIRDILLGLGAGKVVCRGPEPITAGPVEHLITRIESDQPTFGEVSDWAKALHPTPAVCGMPKGEALKVIDELENFDRSLYAGYIGWMSSENSRFYVNLRCMQVSRSQVALFAGGGITALSNPESEWEETVNKLDTLKSVLRQ